MWRGDTRVGFKLKDQWFDSHPTLCHLCSKPFHNEPAVAYLACCVSAAHLDCASTKLSAVGRCPVCWMTMHNKANGVKFEPVPSVAFLQSVHAFFLGRNYYHVFEKISPPEFLLKTRTIDEANAGELARWLMTHSQRICRTLLDAGHLNDLLNDSVHPSEAVDLFYETLEQVDPACHVFDPAVWRVALMDYAKRDRAGPSAFSLVFRLTGGVPCVEQLHGASALDLKRMGIYYPHLCQLGWSISQNGGLLKFAREDFDLLYFPKDAVRDGAARDARAH